MDPISRNQTSQCTNPLIKFLIQCVNIGLCITQHSYLSDQLCLCKSHPKAAFILHCNAGVLLILYRSLTTATQDTAPQSKMNAVHTMEYLVQRRKYKHWHLTTTQMQWSMNKAYHLQDVIQQLTNYIIISSTVINVLFGSTAKENVQWFNQISTKPEDLFKYTLKSQPGNRCEISEKWSI